MNNVNEYFELEKNLYKISQNPRKIYCAREFKYPSDKQIRNELKKLMQDIKAGRDLNGYLSKQYEKGEADNFWQSYNIHHLHIVKERSKYRLFVAFTQNEAYCLYVDEKHDSTLFKKDKIIEIIVANGWTNKLLQVVNISSDSIPEITEDMRHKLRKCSVVIPQKVGNETIISNPIIVYDDKNISVSTFIYGKQLEYMKEIRPFLWQCTKLGWGHKADFLHHLPSKVRKSSPFFYY